MMRWSRPCETEHALSGPAVATEDLAAFLVDVGVDAELVQEVAQDFVLLEDFQGAGDG